MDSLYEISSKLFKKKNNTGHQEDPFGGHKILGFSCLFSFGVRCLQVGEHDMGFDSSWTTPMTILLHFLLSISSLVFVIPARRITTNGGYRIWPEARFHALAFATRSFLIMLLMWVEQRYKVGPFNTANTMIVLLACAAADMGSYAVGPKYRSNTIRDLEAPAIVRFYFSVAQFYGTAGCLFGLRRYTSQFLFILVIQCNAFLMTLQRRNVASHNVLLTVYGIMLFCGVATFGWEHLRAGVFCIVLFLGNLAAVCRIGLGMNKYVVWIGMSILLRVLRPILSKKEQPDLVTDALLVSFCGASFVAVFACGWLVTTTTTTTTTWSKEAKQPLATDSDDKVKRG